jgi:hypothetical protein
MAAMEPMAVVYVAHAAHAAPIAHATDVTPTETEAAAVTSAEAATTEATPTEATAMTAATATTAATSTSTAHQHQQTVLCIQIGVVGIARLSERCRGSKSKRKSGADTKRDDAAIHEYTTHDHTMEQDRSATLTAQDSFVFMITPPMAIAWPVHCTAQSNRKTSREASRQFARPAASSRLQGRSNDAAN